MGYYFIAVVVCIVELDVSQLYRELTCKQILPRLINATPILRNYLLHVGDAEVSQDCVRSSHFIVLQN